MGRRKIEIQPITHERNRSVTFLKRKNGLFKKAYELGVLCSVEVAVIIFEERGGNHVKLFQYGSTDIHEIVQKHMRHDGEKDTRGPLDFSGNINNKLEDGDDDEGDDDDDIPARSKRRYDGKLKPPPDMTASMGYSSTHRNLSVPQPPPLSLQGISGQSGGGGSTLRISNDRSLGMPREITKRTPRLSLHSGHSKPLSNDLNSSGYPYQNPSSFNQSNHYGHHQPRSHHQQSPNPQYQPFFPISQHASPPPSLVPLQSDFPRNSRGGANGGHGFGLPSRSGSSNASTYENSNVYTGIGRNQAPSSQHIGPASGGGGGSGGDFFGPFLDAPEQTRHQGPGFAMDWPVHGGGASASTGPSGASSSGSAPPAGPGGPGGNGNWLDFLSTNNPHATSPNPGGGGRGETMSWERGGGSGSSGHGNRGDTSETFGTSDRGRGGMGPSSMVVSISGKRKIDEDGPGGGIRTSPASMSGGRGSELGKKSGGG